MARAVEGTSQAIMTKALITGARESTQSIAMPSTEPSRAASRQSSKLSCTICTRMRALLHPTARRVPISRVLS